MYIIQYDTDRKIASQVKTSLVTSHVVFLFECIDFKYLPWVQPLIICAFLGVKLFFTKE